MVVFLEFALCAYEILMLVQVAVASPQIFIISISRLRSALFGGGRFGCGSGGGRGGKLSIMQASTNQM